MAKKVPVAKEVFIAFRDFMTMMERDTNRAARFILGLPSGENEFNGTQEPLNSFSQTQLLEMVYLGIEYRDPAIKRIVEEYSKTLDLKARLKENGGGHYYECIRGMAIGLNLALTELRVDPYDDTTWNTLKGGVSDAKS